MKRAVLISAVLALAMTAVTLAVLAQTGPGPALASQEVARVRFIHASPDAPEVDVLFDGSERFTNTAFGEISEYTDIDAGTYEVTIRLTGTDTLVLTTTVAMTATDYTLAAAGTVAPGGKEFELKVVVDDNRAPPPGMVRGRFVHLVPDAPLPVTIAIEDDPLFTGVVYGDATEYATVPAGSHSVQVVMLGIPVVTDTLTGEPNGVYSFFAVGLASGTPELQILQVLDASYDHHIWLPLIARGG